MRRKELPKRISPNPLLSSVVEVRFESNLKSEDLIELYLNHFSKDFPQILDHSPDFDVVQPANTNYKVRYIFNSDNFSILIGSNIIAFENQGDYKFWTNYSPVIEKNLHKLNEACEIKKIERIGIRYLSFFEDEAMLRNSIIVKNDFDFDNYLQKDSYFRATYFKENINITVQVPQNVIIKKDDLTKSGTLVDIDVSCDQGLPQSIGKDFFELINLMHAEEKAMFFTLLSDEFLATLNPE